MYYLRLKKQFKKIKTNRAAMFFFAFIFSVFFFAFFSVPLRSPVIATFIDDENDGEFDAGTHSDTQWDAVNEWVEMDATGISNGAATFTSRIYDADKSNIWESIAWVPRKPYGKELPDLSVTETAYTAGNLGMPTNELLLHFNERIADSAPGGTDIEDFSGNNFDLTGSGSVSYGADGKFDKAVDFGGGYFSVGDNAALNPSVITIMAWINMDSFGDGTNYGRIIEKGSGGGNADWALYVRNDGAPTKGLQFDANSNATRGGSNNNVIDVDKWYHVAVTYDGTSIRFYVDGAAAGTPGDNSGLGDTATNVYVGDRSDDARGFDGRIDDLAVFSSVLTQDQIQDHYNRGIWDIKFQVRSCDDDACSGETFEGPSGPNSFYTESTTSTVGTPSKTLFNVPDNRYFQYQAVFETSSSTATPELYSVTMTTTTNKPTATIGTPTQNGGENIVTVSATIADTDLDVTSFNVDYSTDNSNWSSSTLKDVTITSADGGTVTTSTGKVSSVDTNVDGSVDLDVEWNAGSDLANTDDTSVYLRITPMDLTTVGTAATSDAFALDAQAPSVPGNLLVRATSTQSVDFEFTATSTETNFKEYIIYYKSLTTGATTTDSSHASSTDADLGNKDLNVSTITSRPTTTLEGLATSTKYSARIWAYDSYNNLNSAGSEIVFYTLATPAAAPTVVASSTSSTILTATINPATNGTTTEFAICKTSNGTSCDAGGYVQAAGHLDSAAAWQTTTTWSNTISVTGLTANTSYQFLVQARNGDQVTAALSSANTAVATAPGAPGTPTLSNAVTSSMRVAIVETNNPSNSTFSIYETTTGKWVAADKSLSSNTAVYQSTSTWGTVDVTGMTTGTPYTFAVVTRNSGNIDSTTSTVSSRLYTLSEIPGSPTVGAPAATTLTVTITQGDNSSSTQYAIYNSTDGKYLAANGAASDNPVYQATSTWTAATASGLTANTAYQFSVIVQNAAGVVSGTSTLSTAKSTLPAQATAPTTASATTSTIAVTIVEADNPATTKFSIYNNDSSQWVSANGRSSNTAVYQTTSTWGTSVTAQALSTSTPYTFTVVAQNTDGFDGATSTPSTPLYTLPEIPSAPTVGSAAATTLDITIVETGNSSTTVFSIFNSTDSTWVAADGTSASAAVYQSTSTWGAAVTASGLSINTSYQFQSNARNAASRTAVTSTASTAGFTLANIPTGAAASADSSTQITVTWGANSNPGTTEYYVEDENDATSNSGWATDTSYVFTGLSAGTSYSFKVKARNGDNTETASTASVSATTNAAASSSADDSGGGHSGSSSGGGGVSLSTPVALTVDAPTVRTGDPTPGVTKEKPSTGDPVKGNIISSTFSSGGGLSVSVSDQVHSIVLDRIRGRTADFTIFSEPQHLSLAQGQEVLVDVHDDNIPDLHLAAHTVNAVQDYADVTITELAALPVSINNQFTKTNSRIVIVRITDVSNVIQVAISEDPEFKDASFQPYKPFIAYTLSEGLGEKTVHVKFRSSGGRIATASDTIELVQAPTTDQFTVLRVEKDSAQTIQCALFPGQSYKSPYKSAVWYITDVCTRRPMKNPPIFFSYFDKWEEVLIVPGDVLDHVPIDQLGFLPWGPKYTPGSGAIIKTVTDPKTYIIFGGKRHWITAESVFTGLGYVFTWIEDVSKELLSNFSRGSDIVEIGRQPVGSVIRYPGSPDLFLIQEDSNDASKRVKRKIKNLDAFRSLGHRIDRIIDVSPDEVYDDGETFVASSSPIPPKQTVTATPSAQQEETTQGTARFNRQLTFGDRGQEVVDLQQALREQGFFTYPTNTGFYGHVTVDAVRKLQVANGLSSVGLLGPATRDLLNSM